SVRVCSFHFSAFAFIIFFFNAPATTETYTLSLHDALPICFNTEVTAKLQAFRVEGLIVTESTEPLPGNDMLKGQRTNDNLNPQQDRKSTRLNSSHVAISYAVFCLKKKKNKSSTDAQSIYYQ